MEQFFGSVLNKVSNATLRFSKIVGPQKQIEKTRLPLYKAHLVMTQNRDRPKTFSSTEGRKTRKKQVELLHHSIKSRL